MMHNRLLLAGGLLLATLASAQQTPPFTYETMGSPPGQTRAAIGAAVPTTTGTIDIPERYGVSFMTDATLRDLGYTYTQAQTEFPRFTEWAGKEGWAQGEVLDQYKITAAINDALWVNDTYIGWGPYMDRPNRISQSRSRIILPHGTFRETGTAVVALGWVTGQGSNVYGQAEATTSAPAGTTPGTMFVVDHTRWNRTRYPNRILMRTSSYGVDFGMVGGIAYSEGTIVEGIRFSGGWGGKAPDPSFYSAGFASGDLGEASTIRNCFAEGFNGDGFASMNGTPALFFACSAFNNTRMGFATLCTNGLNTTTYIGCSADDNAEGKYGNRPWTTGSVCGGIYTIEGDKSETRTAGMIFGNFQGQSNIIVTGGQLDVSSAPIDHWFKIDPKGKSWQLDVRGLQHGFNVGSLVFNVETGQRLSSAGPYVAQSFVVNNSGVWNVTRNGIAWTGGPTPPACTWVPGPETCTTCTGGSQTCTIAYVPSVAGCDPAAGPSGVAKPANITTPRTCGSTSGLSADASVKLLSDHLPALAVDPSPDSFYQSGTGQAVGNSFTVTFSSRTVKGVTFTSAANWGNNWPLTYTVRTLTGSTWSQPKTFTGAPTSTATFTGTTCTGLSITIATIRYPNGPWWSISNLTLQ